MPANLVKPNQRLGTEHDGVGGHELHPAVDAALGRGLVEGALGVHQDFGVAVGGVGKESKSE